MTHKSQPEKKQLKLILYYNSWFLQTLQGG